MTLNDLEPRKERFLAHFSHFLAAAHTLRVSCDELEIDQDNLHLKFSATNIDFSSVKYQPPRFKEVWAHVKQGYPSKNWLFDRYWLV